MSGVYAVTKIVEASPISYGQFLEQSDYLDDGEFRPDDAGYLVEEGGFLSWIPEEDFRREFIELDLRDDLEPYQERLLVERAQLDHRLRKLLDAMRKPTFLTLPPKDRDMLSAQSRAMRHYLTMLEKRSADFLQ